MKNLLRLLMILVSAKLGAQEQSVNSKVSEVVVYRTMAKETRKVQVKLSAGYSEIKLFGISTQMIDASLQVAVKGKARLLSAMVRSSYFSKIDPGANDKKIQILNDSIKNLDKQLRWIAEEKSILNGENILVMELLKTAGTKEEYKPTDLNALVEMYSTRISSLRKKLFDFALKEEGIATRRNSFQWQIQDLGQVSSTPIKEVVLSFSSDVDEEIDLKCAYLVGSAGWQPAYDIYVENTTRPVDLTYKAKIAQNTGVDWKDIKIAVSTINPRFDNNRPLLSPKYVDYVTYAFVPASGGMITNSMQAVILDKAMVAPELGEQFAETDESDISLDFDLDQRYTILSDGREHVCELTQYSIPATYRYHCVPKLDPSAFLMARITDYGKYNLLTGNANVFYGENYVGEIQLNPNITSDTLLVSLGRDERIVVKRTRSMNRISKKVFTGVQRDLFEWEITIRNNKSAPIEIEILDQIPLTRRKEIEVKLIEKSKAEYHEKTGRMLWNLKIASGKSETIRLQYSFDYPEGKIVGEQ